MGEDLVHLRPEVDVVVELEPDLVGEVDLDVSQK